MSRDADGDAIRDDGESPEAVQADAADQPPSSRQALVAALGVPRYARMAVAFAAVFAVAVALFFVGVVSGGRTDFPLAYYPALAFVVFVTTAMLTVAVLVTRRVLRLAVHPAGIVRRAATGGSLAGIAWLVAATGLALGPGTPWAPVVDVATPWAAALTPLGLWAVWTRYKRTTVLRPLAAVVALCALGGTLVLADLAAVDLIALLPDVGGPVDAGTFGLFRAGAIALAAGGLILAGLAAAGEEPDLPLLALAVGPLLGLAAFLTLAPGRVAMAALATGFGAGWLLACWRLRQVTDADVPTGPDPELSVDRR